MWMAPRHRTAWKFLCRGSLVFSPGHQFTHYVFLERAPGPVLTAAEVEMLPILGFMMLCFADVTDFIFKSVISTSIEGHKQREKHCDRYKTSNYLEYWSKFKMLP